MPQTFATFENPRKVDNIVDALGIPKLRPQVAREFQLLGDRLNRRIREGTLYSESVGRGSLKAMVQQSGDYVPTAIKMSAAAELVRRRGKKPHVIDARGNRRAPRQVGGMVFVRFKQRRGRGRKKRKVVGGLYSKAKLRVADFGTGFTGRGGRLKRAGGAEFLIASRIRHAPEVYSARIRRRLAREVTEMNRRLGFLLRKSIEGK